jgi:hypothetical protein
MLTLNDLRKVAARSGTRDIGNVEIDVLRTVLLQLFTDTGIAEHMMVMLDALNHPYEGLTFQLKDKN